MRMRIFYLVAGMLATLLSAATPEAILERSDLEAYHGWIRYLQFRVDHPRGTEAPTHDPARARERLEHWVGRIMEDPATLATMRGLHEWAYLSAVDGTGQPFRIMIPTDYEPGEPRPLSVYMHGHAGDHLLHTEGWEAGEGAFQVAVLGRARGGWYEGLSEADVLAVIDYVQRHWAIDPDRIHLNGGSMGGHGTFRLGSRFPHRFASGRPTCGAAGGRPLGNLLTFPIYATHSDDDWVVPILQVTGPLARLRELGGQAILDATTGLGHAAWEYEAGNRRGAAWVDRQVRPRSETITYLDFTAVDGIAQRAWWAEIAEWGPRPEPARFVLRAGADNQLYVELKNVSRLRLHLDQAPFDSASPLFVSVNGAPPIRVDAPRDAGVVLARGSAGAEWAIETVPPQPPFRLHTPGGPWNLYGGEPLLIVYGTQGDATADAALRAAAEGASRSPHPTWNPVEGDPGPDGVAHANNTFGGLRFVADDEVTADDLARCHLVLIGTAEQNSLVRRLADRLPVRTEGNRLAWNGESVPRSGHAWALTHYNPLATDRLISWFASDDLAAYAPGSAAQQVVAETWEGADFAVVGTPAPRLVLTRAFDSRWEWTPRSGDAVVLDEGVATFGALQDRTGAALRHATGADFALVDDSVPEEVPILEPGTTTLADILALSFFEPVAMMELPGEELARLHKRLGEASREDADPRELARLTPAPGGLEPARRYRVVMPQSQSWAVGRTGHLAPERYDLTGDQVRELLLQAWPARE